MINHWYQLHRVLRLYKLLGIGCLLLSFLLACLLIWQLNQAPAVVAIKGEEQTFLMGERRPVEISNRMVEQFILEFVERRYTWKAFNPQQILERISCLSTPELRKRLQKALGDKAHTESKGESLEQYVAFVRPVLKEDSALVSFDRILRMEGMPLASPVQLSLKIVQGERVPCNPLGLYVHGVNEYAP